MITLESWSRLWLVRRYILGELGDRKVRPATERRVEQHLRDWINPVIGERQLEKLTAADCLRCLPPHPATRNRVLRTLKTCLSDAVATGVLESSPAAEIKAHREEPPMKRTVTPDQVRALLGALRGRESQVPLAVISYTGIRLQEALRLTWDRVDLVKRELHFRPEDCKERKAKVVPFPRELSPYLGQAGEGEVAPCCERKVRRDLSSACEKLGLPHTTPHGLRHSFAQEMRRRGAPIDIIAQQLGHADIKTTKRYLRSQTTKEQRRYIEDEPTTAEAEPCKVVALR